MDLNQLGFARTGFQQRDYLLDFWMEPLFVVGSNRSFGFEVQVAHMLSFSYIIFPFLWKLEVSSDF
jgi:hypothetical protein